MQTCKNCGNEIDSNFCNNCGELFEDSSIDNQIEPPIGEPSTDREDNWVVKLSLLSALNVSVTSTYSDMTIDELKTIVQARTLKKLSTISNILIFLMVASFAAAIIAIAIIAIASMASGM